MFTWIREDPEALVVWVDSEEDKHALDRGGAEEVLHHPALRRPSDGAGRPEAVDRQEAEELIIESWRLRAPKGL